MERMIRGRYAKGSQTDSSAIVAARGGKFLERFLNGPMTFVMLIRTTSEGGRNNELILRLERDGENRRLRRVYRNP